MMLWGKTLCSSLVDEEWRRRRVRRAVRLQKYYRIGNIVSKTTYFRKKEEKNEKSARRGGG